MPPSKHSLSLLGITCKSTMCKTAELFLWIAVFAVEFLVIIVGNIIAIFAFWKLRSVLKRTYYLLINLTIADLAVGLGVIKLLTSNILRLQTSKYTRWARYIAMDIFSGTASVTSLLLIAVERSLATVFPFRHRVLTKRVYAYCIAGVWITSTLITMITTMPEFFRNSILASISRLILASFTVLCLIGICSLYTMMYVYSRLGNPRIRRYKREQNKRLAKTLFIVTMLTFITWIPLVVATVSPQRYDHCVTPTSLFVGIFLQLANSALDPLVYCYRMPEFRSVLKRNFLKFSNTTVNIPSVGRRLSANFPELQCVSKVKQPL